MSPTGSHHDAVENVSPITMVRGETLPPESLSRMESPQDESPKQISLLKLPVELQYMIFDEVVLGPRTIKVHDIHIAQDECSKLDALGQLSTACPVLAADIENWLTSRPNLRRLNSGEIFDPATTGFLLDFVTPCCKDLSLLGHGQVRCERDVRRQAIRDGLRDCEFGDSVRRLIIDVSDFEPSHSLSPLQIYFSNALRTLEWEPSKLQSLECVDLFDTPENYKHTFECPVCFNQDNNWYIAELWRKVLRFQKSCGPKIPCTCCPVFQIRYGAERGNDSERMEIIDLPPWARDGIQFDLDHARGP